MSLSNRIDTTETRQFRIIFPGTLNDNSNLFGGIAMQWMDEVAYITAIRFTRMKVVTVLVENIKFIKSIKHGSMVEIIGRVHHVGNVKIHILVEVFVENNDSDIREKAIEATFVFAAVDKYEKPIRIEFVQNELCIAAYEESLV